MKNTLLILLLFLPVALVAEVYPERAAYYCNIKPDVHDSWIAVSSSAGDTTAIRENGEAGTDPGKSSEDSLWLREVQYFGRSIAFVNMLIITIIFSTLTMIILLIFILLNRTRMEKNEELRQFLMEKYQGLIINYLFGETKPEEFLEIASDNYRRQVLIDQMIDVSVNLKGDAESKLVSLYKHLNLDRDSIERVRDKKWHIKIKGFRELAFMNIKDANAEIYEALNSPNEILRMEAQIALVRLSDDNTFEFLSHLTRPFSLWGE